MQQKSYEERHISVLKLKCKRLQKSKLTRGTNSIQIGWKVEARNQIQYDV